MGRSQDGHRRGGRRRFGRLVRRARAVRRARMLQGALACALIAAVLLIAATVLTPLAPEGPAVRAPRGQAPEDRPARSLIAPPPATAVQPRAPGPGMVAIVIDDLGMDRRATARAIALPAAVTLAFLPYAPDVAEQVRAARARGHEILVHLPMEPEGGADPGPMALTSGLDRRAFLDRLSWNLTRFDGYVGVNNHMGSRLTADRTAMRWLMRDLKARGLIFLDSRTTPASVAADVAREQGVPHAVRRVFLDHERGRRALEEAFARIEALAATGPVVAIGHPHRLTLAAVRHRLARADRDGLAYVPISAVVTLEAPRIARGTGIAGGAR